MLPEYFEFTLPTKVIYGIGILKNIANEVKRFGQRRAILVTDKVLVKTGLVDRVKTGFEASQIDITCVFDDVPPNSTIKTVEACAEMGTEHQCDMVLALGGGSVIDTAKVANLLMVKGGRVSDHMGAYLLAPSDELLPAIVIPTTAGTGSEVTRVAVIADPDNDVKLPFTEDQFLPQMAVLDPEMTVSMPGKLTASTGMDALTHAIEAYVDKEWSPASDAMALHAIRLITRNILPACAHPNDLKARGGMLVGSFLAGVAFSHSMVGMVHGISHALGGVYHIPHGLANALILPEVMEFNLPAGFDRFADIAVAMGISFPHVISEGQSLIKSSSLGSLTRKFTSADQVRNWFDTKTYKARDIAAKAMGNLGFIDDWIRKQAAWAAVEEIRSLNRRLSFLTGMPLNLKDAGITDNLALIDQVVSTAMEDGAMLYNPIEPTPDAVKKIVVKVFDQKIAPLAVEKEDLVAGGVKQKPGDMKNVFKDTEMLYDVLIDFYQMMKTHPDVGPALKKSGLCIQFVYRNPSAVITIDATGQELLIIKGEFDGKPEVTMKMEADFAHRFWHGKANLVSALTRKLVTAKGNVPKTLKLLPILKPAYKLYPEFLRKKGLEDLVIKS